MHHFENLNTVDNLYFTVVAPNRRPITTLFYQDVPVTTLGHGNGGKVVRLNPDNSSGQRIYITPMDIDNGTTTVEVREGIMIVTMLVQ
jgi:hypothetical protein